MWEKVKAWAKWAYDWVTVITSISIGFISTLAADQLAPFLGADRALKIIMGVAVIKAAIEYVKSRNGPPPENPGREGP